MFGSLGQSNNQLPAAGGGGPLSAGAGCLPSPAIGGGQPMPQVAWPVGVAAHGCHKQVPARALCGRVAPKCPGCACHSFSQLHWQLLLLGMQSQHTATHRSTWAHGMLGLASGPCSAPSGLGHVLLATPVQLAICGPPPGWVAPKWVHQVAHVAQRLVEGCCSTLAAAGVQTSCCSTCCSIWPVQWGVAAWGSYCKGFAAWCYVCGEAVCATTP